jgi:hypothetical protein
MLSVILLTPTYLIFPPVQIWSRTQLIVRDEDIFQMCPPLQALISQLISGTERPAKQSVDHNIRSSNH